MDTYKRRLEDVASSLLPLVAWRGTSSERTGGSRETKKTGAGTSGRAVAAAILWAVSVVAAAFLALLR
jgi:hypothetical protein